MFQLKHKLVTHPKFCYLHMNPQQTKDVSLAIIHYHEDIASVGQRIVKKLQLHHEFHRKLIRYLNIWKTHSTRVFRTRASWQDWSSTKYGNSSSESNERSADNKISLACFKDESFTAKSPWLFAAARRESACSRCEAAMSSPRVCKL